jgi:hypothetical protein
MADESGNGAESELCSLLKEVADLYEKALRYLENEKHDELNDLLDRKETLYRRAEKLIGQCEAVDLPEQLRERLVEAENTFERRLSNKYESVRQQLVETKRRSDGTAKYVGRD